MLSCLVVSDLVTPWTAAHQAPPSMGFSRQEYWSRVPLPSPIDLRGYKLVSFCFPGGSGGKESTCSEGNLDSIPGLGRSSGGGHSNPLQYSCLENPRDGGAWWAAVYGVTQNRTRLK